MQLKIQPSTKNHYPIGGFLIKSPSLHIWVAAVQRLGFALSDVEVYPVPDTALNSVWGCFVLCSKNLDIQTLGQHEGCQVLSPNLFLAEKTSLKPILSAAEIAKLFPSGKTLVHPDFGWVLLEKPLDWSDFLLPGTQALSAIQQPAPRYRVPQELRSFHICPVSPEEALLNMTANAFPQKGEPTAEAPLTTFEKAKLAFYEMLLGGVKKGEMSPKSDSFSSKIAQQLQNVFDKDNQLGEYLMRQLEELRRRNQKQADNLLELFKKDPNEALKYAIPLDTSGAARGGTFEGEFQLSKLWSTLNWTADSNTRSSSGGSVYLGDEYYEALHRQYLQTAEDLVKEKAYQNAAFVYMKLLKDYNMAAQTLEQGKFYQEAASIYLKHLYNKPKAAECYEKGNILQLAIDLYIELNQYEKIGDLYLRLGNREEANVHYDNQAEAYKSKRQFVKAALIYRNKMQQPLRGQEILLEGWDKHYDAENCLHNYFANIADEKALGQAIRHVYKYHIAPTHRTPFLQILRNQYKKQGDGADEIRQMAYEIVAAEIEQHPLNKAVLRHLVPFNKENDNFVKDIMAFGHISKR